MIYGPDNIGSKVRIWDGNVIGTQTPFGLMTGAASTSVIRQFSKNNYIKGVNTLLVSIFWFFFFFFILVSTF